MSNGKGDGMTMTDEQMKLLTALVENQDMQTACEASGISRATAYRWVKEPEFRRRKGKRT